MFMYIIQRGKHRRRCGVVSARVYQLLLLLSAAAARTRVCVRWEWRDAAGTSARRSRLMSGVKLEGCYPRRYRALQPSPPTRARVGVFLSSRHRCWEVRRHQRGGHPPEQPRTRIDMRSTPPPPLPRRRRQPSPSPTHPCLTSPRRARK